MRTLFRLFIASWRQLFRQIWISVATLLVFCLLLISLHVLVGLQVLADQVMHEAEQRVDISVTFKPETPSGVVDQARSYLISRPETASVELITAAQALEQFRARHQGNDQVLQALDEIGRNPLSARFVVQAKSLEGYPVLVEGLQSSTYASWIQAQSYRDHQEAIHELQNIRRLSRIIGSGIVLFFTLIGLLMVFNTVRLAVFTQRDEITIMRLVGASRWFIRTPFLLAMIWLVCLSVCLSGIAMWFTLQAIDPWLASYFTRGASGLMLFARTYGPVLLLGEVLILSILYSFVGGIAVGKYIKR